MDILNPVIICEFLQAKFPDIAFKNGFIDTRITNTAGVFMGSDTRQQRPLNIGGVEATVTNMLPINIEIRWNENTNDSYAKAIEVYNGILQHPDNFMLGTRKIAYLDLLDSCPVDLGRDDDNICRSIIRINVHYYV